MTTRKPPGTPPAESGLWRIVGRDGREIASFKTEALARDRWYKLTRTRAGEGAKLLRPDGTVDASRDET